MANELRILDLNPIDWTTRDTGWIPADGEAWYFHSHPGYSGAVGVIGDGTNVTGSLTIIAAPSQGGVRLVNGRTYSEELDDNNITNTGGVWFTILETPAEANNVYSGEVSVLIDGASSRRCAQSCEFSFVGEAAARTHDNTTIIKHRKANANNIQYVEDFRWAKSDTVAAAGAKLQVLIDITASTKITTTLNNSTASGGSTGATLVTPYLDTGTVTLPDGATTASFLIAGDTFSRSNTALRTIQGVTAYLQTTTALRLEFNFGQTPYLSATALSLTYTALRLYSGATLLYTFAGTETFGAVLVDGETVYVQMTLSSPATTTGDCALAGTAFSAVLS